MSLAVIVTWAAYAVAEPIYLHACSKTTCTLGTGAGGIDFLTPNLRGVSNSIECEDKCAIVDYGGGHAHVVGHWLDIGCRAWGGAPCMWDRKTYDKETLKRLTKDRYRE